MGSYFSRPLGQAVIEVTVVVTVVLAAVALGAKLAHVLQRKFKHHHLESNTPLKKDEPPFEIKFDKNFVFFKHDEADRIAGDLTQQGWRLVKRFGDDDAMLLLEKDGQHILLKGKMGVKTWPENGDKN